MWRQNMEVLLAILVAVFVSSCLLHEGGCGLNYALSSLNELSVSDAFEFYFTFAIMMGFFFSLDRLSYLCVEFIASFMKDIESFFVTRCSLCGNKSEYRFSRVCRKCEFKAANNL
jgi:hypothetical protein